MITTTTDYTKEIFNDFASYSVRKKTFIFIYVCSVLIIACAIFILAMGDTLGILYLVLGVFFALYGVFCKVLIKFQNKKTIGIHEVYEFDETNLSIKSYNKEGKEISSSKIEYEALHDVKTYKNYGYIYVNKFCCYIVLKQNFKKEEDFDSVLLKIQNNIKKEK